MQHYPLDYIQPHQIFTALADAAEWTARREGVEFVLHYLDDFLVVGRPGIEEGAEALAKLLGVFQTLRFPVATDKLEGLTTCLACLGFELDTIAAMEVQLPSS